MGTEYLASMKEGVLGDEGVVLDCIASTASIPMWSPVILAAAGTGEDMPRVTTTNTEYDQLVFGVAVEQ